MGTRAQIIIEGSRVKLFKHWDGYPESTLPLLRDVVTQFWERRGYEPDMFLAELTRRFKEDSGDEFTGFRLDTEWFADVEYVYRVLKNGDIEIRETKPTFWDAPKLTNTQLVEIVKYVNNS